MADRIILGPVLNQNRGQAGFYITDAKSFQAQPALHDEIFGATGLVVRCRDAEELRALAESLEGQLTATLHLDTGDTAIARSLLPILERKAGRILANGWPTGVEVCHAMVHGGPWPATTDARTTSVGTAASGEFDGEGSFGGMILIVSPGRFFRPTDRIQLISDPIRARKSFDGLGRSDPRARRRRRRSKQDRRREANCCRLS